MNIRILTARNNAIDFSDVKEGMVLKTKSGDKKVKSVVTQSEKTYKYIFSDGTKMIVWSSLEFMTDSIGWKKVSEIDEGEECIIPGDRKLKIVDITPLKKETVYKIETENNSGMILTNGLYVR